MIWTILRQKIEKRFPQNLKELKTAIEKENITQEILHQTRSKES